MPVCFQGNSCLILSRLSHLSFSTFCQALGTTEFPCWGNIFLLTVGSYTGLMLLFYSPIYKKSGGPLCFQVQVGKNICYLDLMLQTAYYEKPMERQGQFWVTGRLLCYQTTGTLLFSCSSVTDVSWHPSGAALLCERHVLMEGSAYQRPSSLPGPPEGT